MSARFAGKTVLVTGASAGLGRGLALAFAGEGAYVYVGYRARAREAAALLPELRAAGGDGAALALDVRAAADVERAVEQVLGERGGIDVLVNNAAVAYDQPFALMEARHFTEVLEVNLTGVFHTCRAVVRGMLARRAGAIVNVGSVAGLHASPGQANYAASKGGLLALTRTLAAELAPRGIRVNAVLPGLLDTGMATRMDRRIVERRRQQIPLGRLGGAAEVAQVVLFLASAEASYVIGQAVVVDGGLTL